MIRRGMAGSFGSRELDENLDRFHSREKSGQRQIGPPCRDQKCQSDVRSFSDRFHEVLQHFDQFVGHKGVATVV